MSLALGRQNATQARPLLVKVETLRASVLWAFVASGFVASVEPSPYEFLFLCAALAYGWNSLLFDRSFIPMLLCLALFEAGGLTALAPYVGESASVSFVATSIYVAITAIFFAALVANNPVDRLRTIKSGYIAAGTIAGLLGVLGYFDVAGLGPSLTAYDGQRAAGLFKDPNVYGPFLVPPIVFLVQDMLLGRGYGLRRLIPIIVMMLGLFLSFSRGAWGVLAATLLLVVGLTFITAQSAVLRRRVIIVSLIGLAGLVAALLIALTIPSVRDIFELRASLDQYYDVGQLGRFGAQWRSLPMLLDRPFGFGPLQFNKIFPQAPHEVYVNAFSAYGWLGGLAFVAFTALTIYAGARAAFKTSPLQSDAITIWSCVLVQMVQGFQIDTDHWRHLFLLIGLLYGLAAAVRLQNRRVIGEKLRR